MAAEMTETERQPGEVADRAPARPRLAQARSRMYMPLVVLVVVGVLLRVWAAIAFDPTVMNIADSSSYITYAHTSLFNDFIHPAGYGLYLKVVGWVNPGASSPIFWQHVMGIATGLLGYALARRAGAPRWAALIPAASVLLWIDLVVLEHQYISEALFSLLITASAYAAVRALEASRRTPERFKEPALWLALSATILGLSAYVRTVGLFLGPFLALWALLVLPKPWVRVRLAGAVVTLVPIIVLALAYATIHDLKSGHFGFTKFSGWAAYARAAPFADCSEFTPPAGTRQLCESVPRDQRPGGDFYAWEVDSPARRAFDTPPNGNEQVGAFGRAAILGQPLEYVETVFNDTVRFFAPTYNDDHPYSGAGYDLFDASRPGGQTEVVITEAIRKYYGADSNVRFRPAWGRALDDLQQFLRVTGHMLLAFLIVAVAGLFAGPRGMTRPVIAMLLGAAMLLLIVPAATVMYSQRYAAPAGVFFAAAAALGAASLWQRAIERARAAT